MAYYFDHYATEADTEVAVVEEDFHLARQELTPSVSLDELRHYERVRSMFESVKEKTEDSNDTHDQRPASSQQGVNGSNAAGGSDARQRAADAMKRISRNGPPASVVTNGSGGGGDHSHPVLRPNAASAPGAADTKADADADDDFVIRTDRMSLQQSSPRKGKGKGKGKSREIESNQPVSNGTVVQDGGDADDAGEDLYD